MLRMLELFAGIAGATVAGDRLGILTTQFVEINPDAQLILREHFPNVPIHDDIKTYHPSPGAFDKTILEREDYTEPSYTPGRIRARYLAGRTVTPPQAAIALRRVLYLNSIIEQNQCTSPKPSSTN